MGGTDGARPALDDYLRGVGARRDGDVATLLAMVKEVLHLGGDEGPSARQRMQSVLDEAGPGSRGATAPAEGLEVVTAPERRVVVGDDSRRTLFLAGGITGCGDWQADMIAMLGRAAGAGLAGPPLPAGEWAVLNPRRPDYRDSEDEARRQIAWEHAHLAAADAVSFWFPRATLCPITLLELGRWSGIAKPIFVGVEPGYARGLDVEAQLSLSRPFMGVARSLEELASLVRQEAKRISARGRSAAARPEELIEDILAFARDPELRETLRGALGLFARRCKGGTQ